MLSFRFSWISQLVRCKNAVSGHTVSCWSCKLLNWSLYCYGSYRTIFNHWFMEFYYAFVYTVEHFRLLFTDATSFKFTFLFPSSNSFSFGQQRKSKQQQKMGCFIWVIECERKNRSKATTKIKLFTRLVILKNGLFLLHHNGGKKKKLFSCLRCAMA